MGVRGKAVDQAAGAVETGPATSRRRSFRRWTAVAPRAWIRRVHLATALVLGLWILVVTTSGALVVFRYDIEQLAYAGLYRSAKTERPITAEAARQAVAAKFPKDAGKVTNIVHLSGGSWEVYVDKAPLTYVYVDGTTGKVRGSRRPADSVMDKISRFHTTLFATDVKLPLLGWSLRNTVLGGAALALTLMAITGAILWWPGVRRFFARAFSVKWRRPGVRRNVDVHRFLGIVALPLLVMWGLTGLKLVWPDQLRPIWYAITPGGDAPAPPTVESKPGSGPGIDATEAMAVAHREVPGARVTAVTVPADAKGYYDVYVSDPVDPYAHSIWAGQVEVWVDRYSGRVLFDSRHRFNGHTSSYVYNNWLYNVHNGRVMPWVPRVIWFLIGFAPLGLALTGSRIWWLKRKGRRSAAARASSAVVQAP